MTRVNSEPLSFDDIDDLLRPVTKINLDNLHPEVLTHLQDQLELLADLVRGRSDRQQV